MREQLAAHGLRGEVHDSYRYAASLFSKVVSDGYIGMVRTIPQLYGFIYDRAERATAAHSSRDLCAVALDLLALAPAMSALPAAQVGVEVTRGLEVEAGGNAVDDHGQLRTMRFAGCQEPQHPAIL